MRFHLRQWHIYTVLWLWVLLYPVISRALDNTSDFRWSEVWDMWVNFIPFIVLFLLHNRFVIPPPTCWSRWDCFPGLPCSSMPVSENMIFGKMFLLLFFRKHLLIGSLLRSPNILPVPVKSVNRNRPRKGKPPPT